MVKVLDNPMAVAVQEKRQSTRFFPFALQNVHEVCVCLAIQIFTARCSTIFKSLDLVHSPDRKGKSVGLDLSASVSSLCLEETSSSATSSTFALGAWATLRKASAPFFADGAEGETSLEF